MTVEQAKGYLRENWPKIREQLLSGVYHPKPVRKAEIPKPNGGVRQLGIPCVVDRLIQQCILQVLQWRVKTLTRRTCGQSLRQIVRQLRPFMPGWKRYFQLADTPTVFDDLDKWTRRRLRAVILYQWGHACTVYRNLRKLGLDDHSAASVGCYISHCRSYWAMSEHRAMQIAFPKTYFDKLGLPRLNV